MFFKAEKKKKAFNLLGGLILAKRTNLGSVLVRMMLCIFHKFGLNPTPEGLETVVLSFLYMTSRRNEETPHQSNSPHISILNYISFLEK